MKNEQMLSQIVTSSWAITSPIRIYPTEKYRWKL